MSDYEPNKIIPGTVYQVVRLLGQGGMGTVYEVEDTTVGKRYVLKTLHAQLRDRKEIAARINKEARVLARLSHPNIVEVVTAGMTGDSLRLPYFLMQKLNGHTLRAVLSAKGRLPLETSYSIAIDLLDALDHAHALGVIHRDVKPENIFLHRGPNEAHQTKLLDFGVMRMLSGEQPQTGGRFVGTLRYAPPEQLRGGPITPRVDLYATGLVIYEMLAGGGPFDDQTTDRDIANAHLEKAPPPLSSKILIAPELNALVMSALSKDPERRPRDAFTFAAKLRELSRVAASARAEGASSQHATLEEALSGMTGASAPDGETVAEYGSTAPEAIPSRARATTLENAGSPTAPIQTLRLHPVRDSIDRSAPTRTAAPLGPDLAPEEPVRNEATTMGAISSHAALPRPRRSGTPVVLAIVGIAIVVGGLALGARWKKGRAEAADAPTMATSAPSPPSLPPPPTAASTPTPTPTPTPTSTPTPTPTSAPTATSAPPLAPQFPPRPRPSTPHRTPPPPPPPDDPAKQRLPGPGF
ncbi:MAG: serine/threonine-protein kinase [Polyangiaceae bacterium]